MGFALSKSSKRPTLDSFTTTHPPEDNMQRRLTDEERKCLSDYVEAFDRLKQIGCYVIASQALEMLTHNTTDGLPYFEPPLTDEDARQRIWVMVRDGDVGPWYGPKKLAIVNDGLFHTIEMPANVVTPWRHARRAAVEEIAAAGMTPPVA